MSRNMYSFIAAVALGCASITSHAQSAPTYQLTFIGSRLPSELEPLGITDLNDEGEVVGARPSSDAGLSAFVWRNGVFRDLRPLLGNPPSSAILGSNDKSAMIGWYEEERNNPDTLHFFLLNRGKVTLIETPPPLTVFSPFDINDRGQVVLAATDAEFFQHYFLWQRGQLSPELEQPPGAEGNTPAVALNDRGLVVGTAFFEDRALAVLWQDGKVMPLDLPADAVSTTATTLNDEGVVIGEATLPTHSQPFIWNEGAATLLPLLPGKDHSQVSSINDLGVVIGTSYDDSSGEGVADPIATLWRHGRARDINTLVAADDPLKPFVQLQWGLLINNAGQLVVLGHDARDADPTQMDYYFLTAQ
jgi:uncharacterized membrane protein